MMPRNLFVSFITGSVLLAGCMTNRPAYYAANHNVMRMSAVKMGQTIDEVRSIMKHGPESSSTKALPDGTVEERWNYITDYENDVNTTLVFHGGKLVEITRTPWLGDGDFRSVP